MVFLLNSNSREIDMSKNQDIFRTYQASLIYACLDDFTATSALHNLYGGQDGKRAQDWALATVRFIYRNLVVGLIQVSPHQPSFHEMSPEGLCELLRQNAPHLSSAVENADLWVSVLFCATPLLEELVARYHLLSWAAFSAPLNISFSNEIREMYRLRGVGFEKDVFNSDEG